eukprot:SAG11_NODE_1885_length_4119_cov_7.094527_2_plen_72_part_00
MKATDVLLLASHYYNGAPASSKQEKWRDKIKETRYKTGITTPATGHRGCALLVARTRLTRAAACSAEPLPS